MTAEDTLNAHGLRIPESELKWSFARSGGPGGQNVNKVNSKAVLRFQVRASPSLWPSLKQRFSERYSSRMTTEGELVLSADGSRSQSDNQEECRQRLYQMIATVIRPPKRRIKTRPSRGAKERRLKQKKQAGQRKQARRKPTRDDW